MIAPLAHGLSTSLESHSSELTQDMQLGSCVRLQQTSVRGIPHTNTKPLCNPAYSHGTPLQGNMPAQVSNMQCMVPSCVLWAESDRSLHVTGFRHVGLRHDACQTPLLCVLSQRMMLYSSSSPCKIAMKLHTQVGAARVRPSDKVDNGGSPC